jgi:hypothetical protein
MSDAKRNKNKDKGSSKLAASMLRAYTDVTAPPEAESPKDTQRLTDAARTPIKVGSTSIAERENPDDLYQKPMYREENDFSIGNEGPEEGGVSLGLAAHPTLPQRDGMPATRLSKIYDTQKRKYEKASKSRKEKEALLLELALKNKPELKLKQSLKNKPEAPRNRPGYSPAKPRPPGF